MRVLRASLVCLLLSTAISLHLFGEQVLTAPNEAVPGGALTLTVFDPQGSSRVAARLLRGDGAVVVRGEGFPLPLPENREVSVVLLGVPTTLAAGSYRLQVTGENDSGRVFSLVRTIEIRPKSFRDERVRLRQSLTDLRRMPSARKEAEARELESILSSFHSDHVYAESSFMMPLASWKETSRFGDRREYLYADGQRARTIHSGIDLAAPAGTPVFAAGNGRVAFAGTWLVTGNTVVVEQLPGVYTLYYHLSEISVTEGQAVKKGAVLGRVGESGLATGPHLHWEVRVGGVAVDPRPLIETGLVDPAEILHNITTYRRTGSEGG